MLSRIVTELLGRIAASRLAAHEKRRDFTRAVVDSKVTIFLEGRTFRGRIHDVSISGAMLEPHCGLSVGDEIELELPNIPGRVQAQVMRRVKDKIGVRFSSPGVGVLIAGWSRGTSSIKVVTPAGDSGR